MRDAGTEIAVLEATSHGLAQHRVTGCAFDVAVITNITHEHLDFHGTYEAYREAKALLFRSLAERTPISRRNEVLRIPKTAVLNRDDSSFELSGRHSGRTGDHVWRRGRRGRAQDGQLANERETPS